MAKIDYIKIIQDNIFNLDYEKKPLEIFGFIYVATNLLNQKKYVGQTQKTLKFRIYGHLKKAKNFNKLKNNKELRFNYFQRAIKKYGIEKFSWKIVSVVYNDHDNLKEKKLEELDDQEKIFINYYNSNNPKSGYNLTEGGRSGKLRADIAKRITKIKKRLNLVGEKSASYKKINIQKVKEWIISNPYCNLKQLDDYCKKELNIAESSALLKTFGITSLGRVKILLNITEKKKKLSIIDTNRDGEYIISLYNSGKSIVDIKKITNYNPLTISRYLHSHNINIKRHSISSKEKLTKKINNSLLLFLYNDLKLPFKRISNIMKLNCITIAKNLKKNNVIIRKSYEQCKIKNNISDKEIIEKIKENGLGI